MKFYPVLITVYNRINHIKQCVESLRNCIDSDKITLYIASDAPYDNSDVDSIKEVRNFINSICGFKEVICLEWSDNLGILNSLKKARSLIFSEYDAFILMEDDNIVAPYFYRYMNYNLNYWQNNPNILYICGYMYPIDIPLSYEYDVLFLQEFNAWGCGMWRDKYVDVHNFTYSYFDKDSLKRLKQISNASYYIVRSDLLFNKVYGDGRRAFSLIKNNSYAVFPRQSLVKNIGHDGSGLHCGTNNKLQEEFVDMSFEPRRYPTNIILNSDVQKSLTLYRKYTISKKLRIYIGRIYFIIKKCFLKN